MIKKKDVRKLLKQLEVQKKVLAATRDELREIEDTAAEYKDQCKDAIEGLEIATSRLSELL